MNKTIYCVYDADAQVISNDMVFLATNDAHAIRMLREAIPADALPRKYPNSFELVRIGVLDVDSPNSGCNSDNSDIVCKFTSIFPEEK